MKKVILIHKVKILYNEKWENVYYKNKKTIYLISNYGRLKNKKKNKLLKGEITKYGYLRYHITINKKLYHVSAHRLVAKAFIPNPKNKPEVNHKDGNKLNNKVSNLEWVTSKENIIHAFNNGLIIPIKGENHYNNKYNNLLINDICELLSKDYKPKEICKKLNIKYNRSTQHLISDIKHKKSWKHISKEYNIKNNNLCIKYNQQLIDKICKLIENNYSYDDIIIKLDLKDNNSIRQLLYKIKNRKRWIDISKKYQW